MTIRLRSRRVLVDGQGIVPATLTLTRGMIVGIGEDDAADAVELGDRLLAPGLVDIHGDAFERQLMPRPGVMVDLGVGLEDTDRQLVANGITTAFHGLTWSWEPGLRSVPTGKAILATAERLAPRLLAEHRWHLRFETFNLDGLESAIELVRSGRLGLVAFNDHTPAMAEATEKPTGNLGAAIRAGVSLPDFNELARRAHARAEDVVAGIAALAGAAAEAGLPLLSHDDPSPEARAWFRAHGCRIAEFPKNLETAQAARDAGDEVVMGAPNVLRGKSHLGWLSASEAVAAGVCTVLASDYYYPALLQAAYRLVQRGLASLPEAWRLVSAHPARAAGLADRGVIALGRRADLIVVDDSDPELPRPLAALVAGQRVWQTRDWRD